MATSFKKIVVPTSKFAKNTWKISFYPPPPQLQLTTVRSFQRLLTAAWHFPNDSWE